jgi:hypothetical protein
LPVAAFKNVNIPHELRVCGKINKMTVTNGRNIEKPPSLNIALTGGNKKAAFLENWLKR